MCSSETHMLIDEETERGSPGAVMRDTFRSAQCSHSARRGSTVLFEKEVLLPAANFMCLTTIIGR